MTNDARSIFEILYNEYHPMVHRMCMGFMKGDSARATDMTQETFINVWIALPGFKRESSHKTWIYRIAVNTCLQHIRKEKSRKRVLEVVASFQSDLSPNAADDNLSSLFRAIGSLNEVDRLIITMVLDEMEYDEIARVVGIEEPNLRVRIHRIKGKLKTLLKHEQRVR